MAQGANGLVLLHVAAQVPAGVLTRDGWRALEAADEVLAREVPEGWGPALEAAGVAVHPVDGGPDEVAARLLDAAASGRVVWLVPPGEDDGVPRALTRALVQGAGPAAPQVESLLGSWEVPGSALLELVQVMDVLRSPGGCPWDAEQTHASLLPYALEEAFELAEAVETGDREHLVEELGDLLLQVVFHARVAQDDPDEPFDVDAVAGGIVRKLRRRHPHVFGDADAPTAAHVEASWEQIKKAEKGRESVLDGVPVALPALARADKVLGRVDRTGLDVPLGTADGSTGERLLAEVVRARGRGEDPEAALRASVRALESRARAAEAGRPAPTARLRAVPASMDAAVVGRIDERLAAVAREEGVAIPLAIESGSRAWGFPSPDSDYDCRFVYLRAAEDYLSPWLPRDVVETPLDGLLDVGGWDLRKAVQLLVRGNAVVLEWLRSPIAYGVDTAFRDSFLELAEQVADPDLLRRHHLHVGRGQWEKVADALEHDAGAVPLKRLFYALRPALTLRWLDQHPGRVVPPMDLPALVAGTELPAGVADAVGEAVARKAVSREAEAGQVPSALLGLVRDTLARDDPAPPAPDERRADEARRQVAGWFRGAVARWAPDPST
jgi:predicted nucleotidyltransferase/NTP pyrophosphatase (non-canonical NTP hydrolase)